MAKRIYYTESDEEKAVYHTKESCPEGKKILPRDKIVRVKCEVCARS